MALDAASNYLRDKLNDLLFGAGASPTASFVPATWYFALFTTMPTSSGGGVEVSGGSYARVAKTNNVTNFAASSGQVKTNATLIDWGTATGNWGTILGIGAFDASSGGNLQVFGLLSASQIVNSGQAFSLPANAVNLNWAA
jgi:hypothetical protein